MLIEIIKFEWRHAKMGIFQHLEAEILYKVHVISNVLVCTKYSHDSVLQSNGTSECGLYLGGKICGRHEICLIGAP